jgi:Tol biopolymer transport system component
MNESIDRLLADWLHEGPESGPRAGLERTLAATRRVGQRPGWTLPERWIPMQLTMARTRSQRPILALAMLALLIVALVATVLYVGALRLPTPSLYRNGAIVYEQDGDLFIADQLGGTPRSLVPGPETDSDPVFSPQGDRVAFIRDRARIMTVSPDGSDVKDVANPGAVVRLDWSPDGSALLASTFSSEDLQALTVVQSDGSGSRTLDLNGIYTVSGSWRPDGQQIAFVGYQAGALAAFIADADGTNVHPLGVGPDDASDGPDWSPNGKQLSFLSPDGITIADIAEDGAVTDVRQLKLDLDPDSTPASDPKWSPDGSQLALAVRMAFTLPDGTRPIGTCCTIRVAIADADGSGLRLVGRADWTSSSPGRAIADFAWSPDGRSLFMASHAETRPMEAWSVDVATGEQTKVGTPVESWQRLAP